MPLALEWRFTYRSTPQDADKIVLDNEILEPVELLTINTHDMDPRCMAVG